MVLTRQRNEQILIGDDIVITLIDLRGSKARIGIDAPKSIPVHRRETYDAIRRENRQAASLADPGAARVVPATAAGKLPDPHDDPGIRDAERDYVNGLAAEAREQR